MSAINIELPDGKVLNFVNDAAAHSDDIFSINGFDIVTRISKSLSKEALLIAIENEDGILELKDLSYEIKANAPTSPCGIQNANIKVRIITAKDKEALEVIRHDAAHILAEAVKELFPHVQVTIGPAIDSGFYYDFASDRPFSRDDLALIEKKMHEIVARNEKIEREVWKREEAVKFFLSIGEEYKAEIIESIDSAQEITMYRQGSFIDLCRGPHLPSTSKVKHFKLLKTSGAYWRGDSKNQMLQRIYGTAFASKEALENYLNMLLEAEKRDHRKIGQELGLFHFQDEARGMPFWHDKGYSIYRTIEQYIRNKIKKAGYKEVKTPVLVDKTLWEESGHWEKFRENMFALDADDKTLALKPMNCPCHVQIFKQGTKSYRDLPIRMSEFGLCHRNESSGGLHGLMRVRSFAQDDAHIFCSEEQIISETVSFCKLLQEVYKDFGFEDIEVKFSDRPKVRAGSDDIWDLAESSLKDAVKAANLEYTLNPGDGAFYGPKLEFCLRDAIGRSWQCGTLQVDFVLPERLDASYISTSGAKKRPVMLHRAILGTFERFIGILIEEHAGKFPLWLAPVQIAIVTITSDIDQYACDVYNQLILSNVRCELDISSEKVNYKIRNFMLQKTPVIIVLGKQEMRDGTVNVRMFGSDKQEVMKLEDVIGLIEVENAKFLQ